VARLAKVHLLNSYDDLDLIDQYATRYGLDPDWVFYNSQFDTVMGLLVKWKEESEYRERFQSIWHEIHDTPKK